jgi:hypothetical protein
MADKEQVESSDSKSTQEEQKLPKLSMADFRTYNNMAEHMEYFVSVPSYPTTWTPLIFATAQSFPSDVESYVPGMLCQQAPSKHVHQAIHPDRLAVLPTP